MDQYWFKSFLSTLENFYAGNLKVVARYKPTIIVYIIIVEYF